MHMDYCSNYPAWMLDPHHVAIDVNCCCYYCSHDCLAHPMCQYAWAAAIDARPTPHVNACELLLVLFLWRCFHTSWSNNVLVFKKIAELWCVINHAGLQDMMQLCCIMSAMLLQVGYVSSYIISAAWGLYVSFVASCILLSFTVVLHGKSTLQLVMKTERWLRYSNYWNTSVNRNTLSSGGQCMEIWFDTIPSTYFKVLMSINTDAEH